MEGVRVELLYLVEKVIMDDAPNQLFYGGFEFKRLILLAKDLDVMFLYVL